MSPPTSVSSHPTDPSWSHVTIAFTLVVLNSALSHVLQLNVGTSLVIAALRCMAQLIVVAFVLRHVFAVESMWAVARLARKSPTILSQEQI